MTIGPKPGGYQVRPVAPTFESAIRQLENRRYDSAVAFLRLDRVGGGLPKRGEQFPDFWTRPDTGAVCAVWLRTSRQGTGNQVFPFTGDG